MSSQNSFLFTIFLLLQKIKVSHSIITTNYSLKWKIKKQEEKLITKLIKKNYIKDRESIKEISLNMKRLTREVMLTIEIKT